MRRFIKGLMAALGVAALSLLVASSVYAQGSIFLTGHDPDFHALIDSKNNDIGAKNLLGMSISFARDGSTKPILLLQTRTTVPSGHKLSDQGLIAAGFKPCPSTPVPCFRKITASEFRTAKLDDFSVIFIPSDYGGTLTQEEIDALIARTDDIIAYLNAGGGLVALAESGDGNSNVTQGFFDYLPFVVSGAADTKRETGYKVSDFGLTLGLKNSDVNGNVSHNIFQTNGLQVVDVDEGGNIISEAYRGFISREGPIPGPGPNPPPPPPPAPPPGVPDVSSPFWIGLLALVFALLIIRELRRQRAKV